MTIQDLGALGDLLSSLAVFVSLIYLAVQVRRNAEATRSSTYQSIVSEFGAINTAMTGTPDLSSLFVNGMEDFESRTSDERAKLSQLFFLVFRNFENMYYQHRAGHLDDDLWVGWKTMMVSYGHRPGFQQWWRFRRPVFSQDFVDFIDNTEIEPIASYFDLTRQRS
jgi:hypothetical protein